MMTHTENERLAVVESELKGVKSAVHRMEGKLDAAIECKADKSEVDELKKSLDSKASADDFAEMRKLLVGILVSVAAFALVTLVGIVLLRVGLG